MITIMSGLRSLMKAMDSELMVKIMLPSTVRKINRKSHRQFFIIENSYMEYVEGEKLVEISVHQYAREILSPNIEEKTFPQELIKVPVRNVNCQTLTVIRKEIWNSFFERSDIQDFPLYSERMHFLGSEKKEKHFPGQAYIEVYDTHGILKFASAFRIGEKNCIVETWCSEGGGKTIAISHQETKKVFAFFKKAGQKFNPFIYFGVDFDESFSI